MSEVAMYHELQNNIFEFYKGIIGRKINDPNSEVYERIRDIATSFISDKTGFIYDERHTENSFRWTVCKNTGEFVVGKIEMEENDDAYLVSSFSVETDNGTRRRDFAKSRTLPWDQYNHWKGMCMFAKEVKQLLHVKSPNLTTLLELMRKECRLYKSICDGWIYFKHLNPSKSQQDYLDKVSEIVADVADDHFRIKVTLVDKSTVDFEIHYGDTETVVRKQLKLPCWF